MSKTSDLLSTMPSLDQFEVIKNLKDGDVLWVSLHDDADEDEMDAMREILEESLSTDVHVLVTKKKYIQSFQMFSLKDLMDMHKQIEEMIISAMKKRMIGEES